MEHKNVWTTLSKKQIEEVDQLTNEYRVFLDTGKTERE